MKTEQCGYCWGQGHYASALTDWYAVPCDRCNGTGYVAVPVAISTRKPLRIAEPAKKMRAQLAALNGQMEGA